LSVLLKIRAPKNGCTLHTNLSSSLEEACLSLAIDVIATAMSMQVLFDVRHLPSHGKASVTVTDLSLGTLDDCVVSSLWPDQASTKVLKIEVAQLDVSKRGSVDTFFVQGESPLPDHSTLDEGMLSTLSETWTTASLDALDVQRQHLSLHSHLLQSSGTKAHSPERRTGTKSSSQAGAPQTARIGSRTPSPEPHTAKSGGVQTNPTSKDANNAVSLRGHSGEGFDDSEMLRTVQSAGTTAQLAGGIDMDTLCTVQSASMTLLNEARNGDSLLPALTLQPPAISQVLGDTVSGNARQSNDHSAKAGTATGTWLTLQTGDLQTQELSLNDGVVSSRVTFAQTGTWIEVNTEDLKTQTFLLCPSTWKLKSQRCGGRLPKLYCIRLYMHNQEGELP
jgi:hypothetical protein